MKKFITALFILCLVNVSFAQFDKPVFQLTIGLTNPDKQLRGNDYIDYTNVFHYHTNWPYVLDTSITLPYQMALIDSNLFTTNYGAKTGFSISGTAKINVDKYETFRLIGSINFSSFNTFQPSKSGYTSVLTTSYFQQRPISYDYNLNNFGLALGIEVAPLAFTKVVSPFVNGNLTFNFLSAKLSRTTGPNDSTTLNLSDFRMGINFSAGLEFRVSPQWGFLVGAKYDFGNLIFQNTDRSGMMEWGRTNASFNDEQGYFTSNIYDPLGLPYRADMKVAKKEINWATFFVGINFYPNMTKPKPKK